MRTTELEKIPLYELSDVICRMYSRIIEQRAKRPGLDLSENIEMVTTIQDVSGYYYTLIANTEHAKAMMALAEQETKVQKSIINKQQSEIKKLLTVIENT